MISSVTGRKVAILRTGSSTCSVTRVLSGFAAPSAVAAAAFTTACGLSDDPNRLTGGDREEIVEEDREPGVVINFNLHNLGWEPGIIEGWDLVEEGQASMKGGVWAAFTGLARALPPDTATGEMGYHLSNRTTLPEEGQNLVLRAYYRSA
jgi:hypothetical protein